MYISVWDSYIGATYIRQTIANKSKLPQPIQSTLQSYLEKVYKYPINYMR